MNKEKSTISSGEGSVQHNIQRKKKQKKKSKDMEETTEGRIFEAQTCS